jgi:hypothetical protein
MAQYTRTHEDARGAKQARTLAGVVGAVFLLVGVLGFVPGVTTDYESLTFAGPESHAELLGIFQVSILHNIVHLIFGVVGLLMARTGAAAVTYLAVGGVVYLVLTVYGFVVGHGSDANFVPVNNADNWLHLGLGLGMLLLAMVARQRMTDGATRTR